MLPGGYERSDWTPLRNGAKTTARWVYFAPSWFFIPPLCVCVFIFPLRVCVCFFFCESSLLRINQRHHSLRTRLWIL